MAISRFEFVGFRKNGQKGTEIVSAVSLSVAQSMAKKKLKTIVQTIHLPDIQTETSGHNASNGQG
ncbi:MAG: hypothetical protein RSD49_08355 [Hafnia sp.]